MSKFFLFVFVMALSGCSQNYINNKKSITELPLTRDIALSIHEFWPLQNSGTYLQQVNADYKGDSRIFSVYLDVREGSFKAVAFHDVQGRIYQLELIGNEIIWDVEAAIADQLQPEYILADFFVANLPLNKIQKSLTRGSVTETIQGGIKFRHITLGDKIVRTIKFSNRNDILLGDVKIENPEHGYSLMIKTVDLK